MEKLKWQIALSFITFFLGFLLLVQFRAQQQLNSANYPTRRVGDLLVLLQETEKARDDLAMKVSELRQQLFDLVEKNSPEMQEEVQKARILAGLTPVVGKGIEITLTESAHPSSGKSTEVTDVYKVQPEDLLTVINELRASGAEAIALNDQRITALSEIRNAGQNILVNNTIINSPFVIQATGNPQVLESSLLMRGGVIDYLKTWQIRTKIEVKNMLKLPPYRGTLRLDYTVIAPEE